MKRALIESGSHVPGVDPARFGMPSIMALRYEMPAADFAEAIADYHVLDSVPPAGASPVEWMLPNAPAIRINLADHDMGLAIGDGGREVLPRAAFYGPTSRAAELMHGRGGVTVGINLTAIGVARLFRIDLATYRDRVVPLDTLLPASEVEALVGQLAASDLGPAVKPILDRFLGPLLATSHRLEADMKGIAALLVDPAVKNLRTEAAALGISPKKLERLSSRYFGFPPGLLIRRARLLRSIVAIILAGPPYDMTRADLTYHDHSHFTKDAHRFLGMTPLQFLKLPITALEAVLRARSIVHGNAIAALDGGRAAN